MEADEFWDLCASVGQTCALPRAVPTFPQLSLVDPGVISFLLREEIDNESLFWIIELDMTKKVLLSLPTLYIQEEEEEEEKKKVQEVQGHSHCKSYKRVFHGEYFFPSHFTSYLRKNPIQSRLRSQMMQKAKQERVMQKKQVSIMQKTPVCNTEMMQKEKQERAMQMNGSEAESNNFRQNKLKQKAKQGMGSQKRETKAHLSKKLAGLKIV